MSLLIKNCQTLAGCDDRKTKVVAGKAMRNLNTIQDGFVAVDGDTISDFGAMQSLDPKRQFETVIDASGCVVLPAFCDSHTHIVFAASREHEFVDRINGLTYQQIAERGGGILNSVKKLRATSENDLYAAAFHRLNEIMRMGTGAVEIKSGYGLDLESELKMLRVIKRLRENHPLLIRATFLGAHAVPEEYRNNKAGYISLIINEMLPAIASEQLADYCDVFCESGYFTKEETVDILKAASACGLKGKVHAEQLSHSGGIEAGIRAGAISVDHLEYCNDSDIAVLKESEVIPTILPGAQFFLQLKHPPVRAMIDAGLPVAIASDYNPGSSPSGNMMLMIALACVQYKLTPEEALLAATLNSACAMGVSDVTGSIAKGKKASLVITKEIPSLAYLPYSFGSNLVRTVIINGKPVLN